MQKAVHNVSFTVAPGSITGFLGPNGAGKSTTMKIITGYLQPDAGTATVCGIDVTTLPIETRKKIGYLPEANPLYFDMYVREYLSFIADVHKISHKNAAVEKVIAQVGLSPEAHKKCGQLSKGYKQRVGLAAALIHDPEVLILDEPTSGLDPNQILEIREVIKQLGKEKTVLLSSHIMQEIEAVCDRVIIISKGQLLANNSIHQLKQQERRQRIHVVFSETTSEELLQQLPAATGVYRQDAHSWEIESNDTDALRRQLLTLAIENGLNIQSLRQAESSLEEVFRNLTRAV